MGNDKKTKRQKPDVRPRHGSKRANRHPRSIDRPTPRIPAELKLSDPLCKTCVERLYGQADERWKEAKLELSRCCSCMSKKITVCMRIKL